MDEKHHVKLETSPSLTDFDTSEDESASSPRIRKEIKTEQEDCDDDNGYITPECSPNFSVPSVSQNMKAAKSNNKSFKCSKCSFMSVHQGVLQVHVRTCHTGKSVFECTDCSFVSFDKECFQSHIGIHAGVNPFKCTECSHVASALWLLRTHMLKHTGEKPFKCSECSFATAYKSSLNAHCNFKHNGRKSCKRAARSSANTNNSYLNHASRTHAMIHAGHKFKCTECDYGTTCKSNLRRHVRARHPSDIRQTV